MSDTPRTDAEVFAVDVAFVSHDGLATEPKNVIEPDFARELERENTVFRSLLIQAVLRYVNPHSALTAKDYIARVKTALGEEAKP